LYVHVMAGLQCVAMEPVVCPLFAVKVDVMSCQCQSEPGCDDLLCDITK